MTEEPSPPPSSRPLGTSLALSSLLGWKMPRPLSVAVSLLLLAGSVFLARGLHRLSLSAPDSTGNAALVGFLQGLVGLPLIVIAIATLAAIVRLTARYDAIPLLLIIVLQIIIFDDASDPLNHRGIWLLGYLAGFFPAFYLFRRRAVRRSAYSRGRIHRAKPRSADFADFTHSGCRASRTAKADAGGRPEFSASLLCIPAAGAEEEEKVFPGVPRVSPRPRVRKSLFPIRPHSRQRSASPLLQPSTVRTGGRRRPG